MLKYISLQNKSGFFQHYFVKRFLRGYLCSNLVTYAMLLVSTTTVLKLLLQIL
jgi:hypothetical protein